MFPSCCCLVTMLCPTPMDCSLPGSSVHGISQARVLAWVLQGIIPVQGLNPGLLDCRQILYYCLNHQGSPVCKYLCKIGIIWFFTVGRFREAPCAFAFKESLTGIKFLIAVSMYFRAIQIFFFLCHFWLVVSFVSSTLLILLIFIC